MNLSMTKYKTMMLFICLLTLFSLFGCSSGSGDVEQGEVTIGLTDAEGDFLSYTVDVTSITLTKANGNVVETLPMTTTVDFAQYVDMTEFLTAASVPLGAYKAATLHLDYSNADIVVEGSEGNAVQAIHLLDTEGNPITQVNVDVFLANRSALVVAPGVTNHITLDFDLELSNSVTFEDGVATVTVDPTLTAEVNHNNSKPYRVRGLLDEVDTEYGYFTVDIRPFFHNMKNAKHQFGQVMVMTSDDTVFEINGSSLAGQDGLDMLADLETDTAVIVMGHMVQGEKNAIAATSVYAGTSVPGQDSDFIKGSVMARNGNTLTVNGMVYVRDQDKFMMNDTVIVTIDTTTTVKKQQSEESCSIDDISPGQNVTAQGDITLNEDENNIFTPEMDATQGIIRMNMTVLRGQVADDATDDSGDMDDSIIAVAASPYFTVDLDNISMRNADLYDFAGTGSDVENDALESNYEIETGNLDISEFEAGDDVKIYGFPNAFGAAPYDFLATSVVSYVDQLSLIKMTWIPATLTPFSSMTEEELAVDTNDLTHFRIFKCKGPMLYDTPLIDGLSILPGERGIYVIIKDHETYVYSDFAEFVSILSAMLDGYNRAKDLFVAGTYDGPNSTLSALYLTIKIH